MHRPSFPTSPLAVIQTTIVSSTLASTVLLLALVFALLDPVWSRAALALQAVTLAAMGFSRRWNPTLPPTDVAQKHVRELLALAVSVALFADLLLREALAFRPTRVGVYAGLVDLGEPEPPGEAPIGLRLSGEAGAAL